MSCGDANCAFTLSRTTEELDALLAHSATTEYGYDIEDGFSVCEALSRSAARAATASS